MYFLAEAGELVMLGGEPGQGLVTEVGEVADRGVRLREAVLQPADLVLETGDLSVAGIGALADIAELLKLLLELSAQVRVRTGAVESGAVDAGRGGEGLDVAFPSGRDVAVEQPGYGRPDLRLVVGELLPAESY